MIANPNQIGVGRFVPPALMLSAFGPLLIPSMGVGTSHVFMYMLLPIAIGLLCVTRKILLAHPPVFLLLFIFSFIIIWSQIVTIGGVTSNVMPTMRTRLDELKGFESYLEIIVLIIIMGAFMKGHGTHNYQVILDKVAKMLIILMAINSVIAMLSIVTNTGGFTNYFIPGKLGAGETSFEEVALKGRFTGIFDFPATAGLAYSMALIVWTFLARKTKRVSVLSFILASLIFLGGAVAISKTFILGGLPICIIYWLLPGRSSPRISWNLLIVLSAVGVTIMIYIESWVGFEYAIGVFTADGKYPITSVFLQFISIRYGFDNDLRITGIFPYLWDVAPIQGLGFAYLNAQDSAYLQYFMQGGLISLSLYIGFIATIVFVGANEWYRGREVGRLLTILGLFVFMAGIGGPVITTARISVIFWVITMLVFAVRATQLAEEKVAKKPKSTAWEVTK